jgi:carboxyl-terminal processing protease
MNRLGILVDVSHISDAAFYDVLECSTKPVVATHSCCRALADHPRNMTDDMIRALAAKGSITQASLKYLDSNRAQLTKEYSDIYDFENRFEVDETFLNILREQSILDKVELEGGEEEYNKSLPEIKKQLKNLIARDIWDMEQFIEIYNRSNDMFLKAYELVKEKKFEKLMQK